MEPISLILAALLAGAAKGVGDTAAGAVKDAYSGLLTALRRKLAKPAAQAAVEEYAADPEEWGPALETYLRRAGADRDEVILEAATMLMRQADPDGASAGRYVVNLSGAQGVQVNNASGNVQANRFL